MPKKEEHAIHNRELCHIIRKSNKHHDWVVTTAFYSALHFVDLKIFPFPISAGQTCEDLRTAQDHLKTFNKHETRLEMVKLQCKLDISIAYRWLYDNSSDARYKTFRFTPTQADKAIEMLTKIENYCTTAQ